MSITSPAGDAAVTSAVARALDSTAGTGWRVLHHVRWPGHPGVRLAHVAIGPGGIVVVTEGGPALHEESVDPQLADVACACAAVTALLAPQHRRLVRGVRADRPGAGLPTRAQVLPAGALPDLLNRLPQVLSPVEVVIVAAHLRTELAPVRPGPRTTTVPRPAESVEPGGLRLVSIPPRRRLSPGRLTTVLLAAGVVLPWVVALALHAV
jgi:hypothetical protein